jgi:predicted transcriptional regulator
LVRYGTEIIKGVGIPQSGQVILLTNKKLVLRRAQPSYYQREAIVAFLTVIL